MNLIDFTNIEKELPAFAKIDSNVRRSRSVRKVKNLSLNVDIFDKLMPLDDDK